MARPLAPMAAIVLAALCAGCGGRDVRTPAGDDEPVTFRERAESALERGDRDGFVRVVEAEIDTLEAWARAFERDLATTDRSAPPQVRAAFRRFRDDLQKALAEARELRRYEGDAFEDHAERLRQRLESLDRQVLTIEEMRLRGASS